MSSSITLSPTPNSIRFVAESEASAIAREYAAGVAYADRAAKVDDRGRTLYRFTALAELGGNRLGSVSVESPTPLPDDLPLGVVLQAVGACTLTIANNRDGFDLRATLRVESYEPAKN